MTWVPYISSDFCKKILLQNLNVCIFPTPSIERLWNKTLFKCLLMLKL